MPKYHYTCEDCGFEEELEQKFGSPREHECPECRGKSKRVIGRMKEATMEAVTPGGCSEYAKENRSANR